MKDLYKRIGVEMGASEEQVRAALATAAVALDAETREAAGFVLLDPDRRAAYDRTHRVAGTIGELRSHLGLNYKPFWARAGMKDFTQDPSAPLRPRGRFGAIRPADLARAFGLTGRAAAVRAANAERERHRALLAAAVLVAVGILAVGYILWTLYASR